MNCVGRDMIAVYFHNGKVSNHRRRFRADEKFICEVSYKTGRNLRYGLQFDVEPNEYLDDTLAKYGYDVIATCPRNCKMV